MKLFTSVFLFSSAICAVSSNINDKYDLSRIPYDLRPVDFLVGKWSLQRLTGRSEYITPPDVLDFGINPIPHFGARALNITAHYFDQYDKTQEVQTMYGFMPVKNATRFDARIHCAFVTTYSTGVNMIEQGLVRPGQLITFHLKQFMRRRFGTVDFQGYTVDELERKIRVSGQFMDMSIQTLLTHDDGHIVTDDYSATYEKHQL